MYHKKVSDINTRSPDVVNHLSVRCTVIGIAGGTGSGKSTLANRLADWFADRVSILQLDNYYHDCSKLTPLNNGQFDFDSPDAIDSVLLYQHVQQLTAGNSIESPVYDFATHTRVQSTITVTPPEILLIEGLMALAIPSIVSLLDLRIFVQSDADIRLLRRMNRDVHERGRSAESVIEQWNATVRPAHENIIEPSSKLADLIVNGHSFERIGQFLERFVRSQDSRDGN